MGAGKSRARQSSFWLSLSFNLSYFLGAGIGLTQVVPDASLPHNTQVIPGCTHCVIEGGTSVGATLIHSFQLFSVPTGGSAYFNQATEIQNILTRVTGAEISNIDGLLKANGNANLFLLNPNGIVFGPNARLEIGGSFTATTATSLKFADGSEFSTLPSAPLLTMHVSEGVQYGPSQPGATIVNQGNLSPGQNLSLVADRLQLQGTLQSGRDLTLQAQNQVQLRDRPGVPLQVKAGRDLTIQGNQSIDLLTLNSLQQSPIVSGRHLSLISDGLISIETHLLSGGNLSMRTLAGQPATLFSQSDPILRANGSIEFGDYTGAALKVEATGSITGGNIRITQPDAAIPETDPDYGILSTLPAAILRAGLPSLSSNVPQTVEGTSFSSSSLAGQNLKVGDIDTSRGDDQNAGPIWLSTQNGNISTGNLRASAFFVQGGTAGNGGEIRLSSTHGTLSTGQIDSASVGVTGSQNAGSITLSTTNGDILVRGGVFALSDSGSDGNTGNGGRVNFSTTNGKIVIAGDTVTYAKANELNNVTGDGGDISLKTTNGAIEVNALDASTASGVGLAGNGGSISVATTNGAITTQGIFTSSFGVIKAGNGGNIQLSTSNGSISVVSVASGTGSDFQVGNGGNITISTGNGNLALGDVDAGVMIADPSNVRFLKIGGTISLSTAYGGIISGSLSTGAVAGTLSGTGGSIILSATEQINPFDISLSSDFGTQNPALIINTAGQVDLRSGLLPNGADIRIGETLSPAQVLLPNAIQTKGGSFTLQTSGSIQLQQTDLNTSRADGSSGNIRLQTGQAVVLAQSRLFTSLEPGTAGTGGNITIAAQSVALNQLSLLDTATFGNGNAGNLQITATDAISLDRSNLFSTTSGPGNGGQVVLQAGREIRLSQGSQISTAARLGSTGSGGDIQLTAPMVSLQEGAQLQALTQGSGPSGDISIQAGTVTLSGVGKDGTRSGIFTSSDTATSGQGGNIRVNAAGLLQLAGGAVMSAQTRGAAAGGTISLQAERLELLSGGQLLTGTAGSGAAGNIDVNVQKQILIAGTGTDLPTVQAPTFVCAVAGVACQTTANSQVEFSTRTPYVSLEGSQDPGIDEYRFTITTPGTRAVFDIDKGGELVDDDPFQPARIYGIDTGLILVNQQGEILAENDNADAALGGEGSSPDRFLRFYEKGRGMGRNLSLGRDAYLRYTFAEPGTYTVRVLKTANEDNWGTYRLQVSLEPPPIVGSIVESSASSGMFASTSLGSTGAGGNIRIDPDRVIVRDGGGISVDSQGSGNGGNLFLQANQLVLDNRAFLSAATAQGEGGNITLQLRDYLLMRRNSLISATASGNGNGGNIQINAGFVISVPGENSDIVANAFRGRGGNIQINTQAILGFQFPSRLTPFSDVTASSEFGLSGVIGLRTFASDPVKGLVPLSLDLLEPSQLITQGCGTRIARQNEFVMTGKGGLAPVPTEMVGSVTPSWGVQGGIVPAIAAPISSPSLPLVADAMVQLPGDRVALLSQAAGIPNSPISICAR